MGNLCCVFMIMAFVELVLIATIIYEFIRPGDEYAIKIIVLSLIVVLWPVLHTSYFQDAVEQETITIIAEYDTHQSRGKLVFVSDMGEIVLTAPGITGIVRDLESGKTYEIEYYKHSKLIKEYKLIE